MSEPMTGARLLAQMLEAYGVTHVFFMDAVLRRLLAALEDTAITRVLGHSEAGVAYMADGYARASGRPGICMAQSVGAANLAAALQDAFLGLAPVIAFTGRHVAAMQYRNAYQEVPHAPLYAPVTKFDARIDVVEQIPHLLRQAFREVTTGTPRPAHLDIAGHTGDILMPQTGSFESRGDPRHAQYPAFRPEPAAEALAPVLEALRASRRPVLVADRASMIAEARAAVAALAERMQIPVVATPDAKAVLVESHPLFAGIVGAYGRSCANRLVAEADLVIYAGSQTSDHTTGTWRLPPPGVPVVQIDIDPAEIGRNHPGAIGVQADVRAALVALLRDAPVASRPEWIARAQELCAHWRKEISPQRDSDAVPLRPERICRELSDLLPQDAVLVADTGNAAILTANFVELRHAGQAYFRAAGSLGWAFPASLGVKCAVPARPVVCFTGDGGFYYHLSELETARRRGLHTVTVVNNNGCLSQGLRNLDIAYGDRDRSRQRECYGYSDTDFARIAEGFDCLGITVRTPDAFRAAFTRALAADRPVVIDVKTEFAAQIGVPWIPA